MTERDIFLTALDLSDPQARHAFLARACGGNAALRRGVDGLLAAHAEAGSFMDPHSGASGGRQPPDTVDHQGADAPRSPNTATGSLDAPPSTAAFSASAVVGTVIAGRYKLLEVIGEGGMGTVFMADQTDPVRRRVAVKLVRDDRDSRAILARFEAERQAIAVMDHPHIAKLLDAGATDQGRPFFVMELVRGVPLTHYCDAHRLTVPDRLRLFQQICSAVQHAHQKGVIHRDLKPSNVLVEDHDGKPVPKVIDFGLAKAAGGLRLTDATLFTGFGAVLGTPQYMAPEQATFSGVDVDTRADVYALGVILYELLAGSPPITREGLRKAALEEMLRAIREDDPPPPSSRISGSAEKPSIAACRQTEPAKLGRFVKGELDWIVMKALAKDRDRRYGSAAAFAEDVGRFLAHEPVAAGPPSAAYRVRKFVARNRGPVVAAGLVFLALLAGMAGTTWGLVEARKQEAAAVAERDEKEKARQAEADQKRVAEEKARESDALVTFFQDKVFAAGRPKGQDGGLGHNVTLREAITAALPAVAEAFRDQPVVEARLRHTLGITFFYLGDPRAAIEQYARARALFTTHRGPDDRDTLAVMDNLANSYTLLGRHVDARGLHEEVLAARTRVLGPDHLETIRGMNNLAGSYTNLGQLEEARKLNERLVAVYTRLLGPDDPVTLTGMRNLANTYRALGEHQAALALGEKVVEARQRVSPPDHPDTLASMGNLAVSYADVGRHRDALALEEAVLAGFERSVGLDHPDALKSMNRLASGYHLLGRDKEAWELYKKAIAAHERIAAARPEDRVNQVSLGAVHSNAAGVLRDLGRPEESLTTFARAIDHLRAVLAREPADATARLFLRNAHWGRAKTMDQLGRSADAAADWDLAIGLSDDRGRNRVQAGRAVSRLQAGRVAEAVAEAAELTKAGGWDANDWYNFACVYAVAAGKLPDRRDEYAARAVELLRKAIDAGYRDRAHIDRDPDLAPLRGRPDFRKLVESLPYTAPPPRPVNRP